MTLSENPSGTYFVSILTEQQINPLPTTAKKVGIDLGLKEFAICSEGDREENSKVLQRMEKQLVKAQRVLSRKQKDTGTRNKARLKVAKLHERITNQRTDFLHKLSTKIIRENQSIVLGELSVRNMMRFKKSTQEAPLLYFQNAQTPPYPNNRALSLL